CDHTQERVGGVSLSALWIGRQATPHSLQGLAARNRNHSIASSPGWHSHTGRACIVLSLLFIVLEDLSYPFFQSSPQRRVHFVGLPILPPVDLSGQFLISRAGEAGEL